MALSEFDIIKKYFTSFDSGEGISLGIGDDCALIDIPQGYDLAVTTDTQNEGIHFFAGTSPYYLGYKSLLVNVSDLAAMGAKPYCFTLSITLPDSDESFLEPFSRGLFKLASELRIPLIGGNTTRGPLSVTISAYGTVKKGCALKRCNAKAGDSLYVTGTLGLPGLAVDMGYKGEEILKIFSSLSVNKDYDRIFEHCYEKSMLIPSRNAFATDLTSISSCAIDISDGLVGDLGHILRSSGVGCELFVEALPKPSEFYEYGLPSDYMDRLCLYGGGDYELLFTVPQENEESLKRLCEKHSVSASRIGLIKNGKLEILNRDRMFEQKFRPFEHF